MLLVIPKTKEILVIPNWLFQKQKKKQKLLVSGDLFQLSRPTNNWQSIDNLNQTGNCKNLIVGPSK